MTNKFRQMRQELPQPVPRVEEPIMGFEAFRSDAPAHILPLNTAARMDHLRLERGGLRKDFGWKTIGSAAPSKILGLFEHKFISGDQTFSRLVRIYQDGGLGKIQVWDGVSWVDAATSIDPMEGDVNLSLVSTLGTLFVADGKRILRWGEDRDIILQEDDFPDGIDGVLVDMATAIEATLNPAGAFDDIYTVNYEVALSGIEDIAVYLRFYAGDILRGSRRIYREAADLPATLVHEIFELTAELGAFSEIAIELERISQGDATRVDESDFLAFVSGTTWEGAKTIPAGPARLRQAWDKTYTFEYSTFGPGPGSGTILVEFWVDQGLGFQKVGEAIHPDNTVGSFQVPIFIDDLYGDPVTWRFTSTPAGAAPTGVNWTYEVETASTVAVEGFNKAIDADLAAGVEYSTLSDPVSNFALLSPDAPGARYIFPFGDRLLALHDLGDKQALAWSADGDATLWTGPDTGLIFLVDGQIDPIDDLMAGALIGHNLAALYRKRSIMRVLETGNVAQAIAAVRWKEGIGTEAPFSVQIVPEGNIFLGHDRMVYILDEAGGLSPVGMPIRGELVKTLTSNIYLVDSAIDSVTQEYWLGIPEMGADHITAVWVFDLGTYQRKEGIFWRRRPLNIRRLAAVSEVL